MSSSSPEFEVSVGTALSWKTDTEAELGARASSILDDAVREMVQILGCHATPGARVEDLAQQKDVATALSLGGMRSAWPSRGFNSWHDPRIEWPCFALLSSLPTHGLRLDLAAAKLIRKRGENNFLAVHVDAICIADTLEYLVQARPSPLEYKRQRGVAGTWTFWAPAGSVGTQVLDLSPSRLAILGCCCENPPPGLKVPKESPTATGGCSAFPAFWNRKGEVHVSLLTAIALIEDRICNVTPEWKLWGENISARAGGDAMTWLRQGSLLAFPPKLISSQQDQLLWWGAGMPHSGGSGPRASVALQAVVEGGRLPMATKGVAKRHSGTAKRVLDAAVQACHKVRKIQDLPGN